MIRNRTALFAALLSAMAIARSTHAASGGPDGLGWYTWADSDEPNVSTAVAPYTPTDLRTAVPPFTGDDNFVPIALPTSVFPTGFDFYGTSYSTIYLSTNGWLSFSPPGTSAPNPPALMPDPGAPNNTLAFFWDNMTVESVAPVANAGPHVALDGFTIFVRYARSGSPNTISQVYITLYKTGAMRMLYINAPEALLSGNTTIGVENATGGVGLMYMERGVAKNGATFRDSYAVQFFPKGKLDCTTGVQPLTCGQPATAYSNLTGVNNVAAYNCSAGSYLGNEAVFSLNVPTTSNLTLTLNNTDGRNRSLFFMRPNCSEFSGCTLGGATTLNPKFVSPGLYYVVVDGATATDNGNFTLAVSCTDAATNIACGDRLTGQATSGVGALTNWSCAAGLSGPENVYSVNVTGPTTLRATLTNKSDPNLFVLIANAAGFNFQSPQCLLWDPAAATLWGATSGQYYVIVDGTGAAGGTYDLEVTCTNKMVCPVPPVTIDVTNPTPIIGTTVGKPNINDSYYCTASNLGTPGEVFNYTGGEDIYEFTLATPASVSFLLSSPNPNIRLLVLRDCYEGSCVIEGACAENLAAGTYRLVVDGLAGASSPYSFTPFVLPAAPYTPWWGCPQETPTSGQTPQTLSARRWAFNSSTYCGTNCDFSLFVVVECGTEFHIPFSDVESGTMQIYDVLQQQFVSLTATNVLPVNGPPPASCQHTSTGTTVQWRDSGCPAGGSDCKTNNRIMDVSFQGTPNVCGVYRLDFLNWGGWAWEVFANCTADATQQFNIYRDLCTAVSAYNPRPEGGIATVVLDDSQCGSYIANGTVQVENIGCLPAAALEVVITQKLPLPANPKVYTVDLLKGESKVIAWDYTVTAIPADLEFTIDPSDRIVECSENLGTTVSCGTSAALVRKFDATACRQSCTSAASAGPSATVCEGDSHTLDASLSTFGCLSGTAEYRWEDLFGTVLCDWSTTPTCNVPPLQLPAGPNLFTVYTRCNGDAPPCVTNAATLVDVIPNVQPLRVENTLRAIRDNNSVRFSWGGILDNRLFWYRLYKDADPQFVSRGQVQEVLASTTTASDEGGVLLPPNPIAFYQVVSVSCRGDLESPY